MLTKISSKYVTLFCLGGLTLTFAVLGALKTESIFAYLTIGSVILLGGLCLYLFRLNSKTGLSLEESVADLKEAKHLLENRLAALEQTMNGIFIVNEGDCITYMNGRLLEMFDIEKSYAEMMVGEQWIELFPLDIQSEIQEALSEQFATHNSWKDEVRLSKNPEKYIELSIVKLPDSGLIGNARDISGEVKAGQDKEILESQFYQAQKMEAVGRLAGGIAHDFNNILAAIQGYAEFLDEDLHDRPSEQKFANKILNATAQARKLVDQILTFSRKNDTKAENVDLIRVTQECLSMLKASAAGTVELIHSFEFEEALVKGNSTQISQAIMNLSVNAIDAMEDEHGTLDIKVAKPSGERLKALDMYRDFLPEPGESPLIRIQEEPSGDQTYLLSGQCARDHDYICITVRDTGTGISRVVMEHVLEPFFTTKPVDKGTGLGLATVHGIISQHQGAMIVDSVMGEGTTFELYFPIEQIAKLDDESTVVELQRFEFEGARVLLVEDQQEVRDMTAKMLLRMGFDIVEAENGLDGLDKIKKIHKEKPFHLVLTDHSMPKMTGLDLAIEAGLDYPDLPFVLLSGYSQEKLRDIMKENPVIKSVLRKPINKEALKQELYKTLSNADVKLDDTKLAGIDV